MHQIPVASPSLSDTASALPKGQNQRANIIIYKSGNAILNATKDPEEPTDGFQDQRVFHADGCARSIIFQWWSLFHAPFSARQYHTCLQKSRELFGGHFYTFRWVQEYRATEEKSIEENYYRASNAWEKRKKQRS